MGWDGWVHLWDPGHLEMDHRWYLQQVDIHCPSSDRLMVGHVRPSGSCILYSNEGFDQRHGCCCP